MKNVLQHLFSYFPFKSWNRPYGFTHMFFGTAAAVTLAIFLNSCGGNELPKPACAEFSPECELLKDFVYVEVDSIIDGEPLDAHGQPLVEGRYYGLSTRTNTMFPVGNPQTAYFQTVPFKVKKMVLNGDYTQAHEVRVNVYTLGANELVLDQAIMPLEVRVYTHSD